MSEWPRLNEQPKKKRHTVRATHKIPTKPERCVEFEVSTVSELIGHTKVELINEVVRLQNVVREVAVELGIARSSPTSEYKIGLHFAASIVNLVKSAWSFNL